MARTVNKLSARFVETIAEPGRYSDGGNLYLSISPNGGRRWVLLYRWHGKPREMGLGPAATRSKAGVSLAEARQKAIAARRQLAEGIDPIEARNAAQAKDGAERKFGSFADALVADISPGFRNAKHRQQWKNTLATYAAPLRDKDLDKITTEDVLGVLKPIWTVKPETASRLRGRIERILDAARARGLRSGENPARWRGHLKELLPQRQKLTRGHHKALPFDDVPEFMTKLRAGEGVAPRALEFAILTAARSGEVLGARWGEFDLDAKVWTVPRERMKAGKEHRVPLSDRAVAILSEVAEVRTSDFVFPGMKRDKPLSVMALEMILRRMKVDVTVHGFRSAFRDWAGETTSFPHEVCEMALAHTIANKAEAAYRRGDLFEKRRQLMAAWSAFCGEPAGAEVVRLTPRKRGRQAEQPAERTCRPAPLRKGR